MRSLFLLPLVLPISAQALVDYTETVGTLEEKGPGSKAENRSVSKMPGNKEAASRSLIWKSDFSFITNYESIEIDGEKIGVINIGTHIQTPFNVFFDASYWNASTNSGSQSGNPRLILGFNWLRFGSPSDEARFNIYGGAKLSSSSELGSSRTDKIFGVETTKRFGTFGLGIGYEMTLVGAPKNNEEMGIGNIQRLSASAGWMVSSDIQFEVEAENYKIAPKKDAASGNGLNESVSFSTLSPKVNLGLAPAINLELGARFRMKKASEEARLSRARVFDLHGSLANSLFAGLNMTL